jgi:hypothetical protein
MLAFPLMVDCGRAHIASLQNHVDPTDAAQWQTVRMLYAQGAGSFTCRLGAAVWPPGGSTTPERSHHTYLSRASHSTRLSMDVVQECSATGSKCQWGWRTTPAIRSTDGVATGSTVAT